LYCLVTESILNETILNTNRGICILEVAAVKRESTVFFCIWIDCR